MIRLLFAALALLLSLATAPAALAAGVIYNAPGQSVIVDYQTLAANAGQVQVYCGPENNLPPPPAPRNCQAYRWTYSVNQQSTSYFTCLASGVAVGQQRSCQADGVCGSEAAIDADCARLCETGAFDGVLPRPGRNGGPGRR